MKLRNLLLTITLLLSGVIFAQETFPPDEIITGTFIGKTGRLDQFTVLEENGDPNIPTVVIDQLFSGTTGNVNTTNTVIQNLQTEPGQIVAMPIIQNFVGMSQSGYIPPDPTGAAGPNHYMHAVNSRVAIFDKSGNILVGPVSLAAFLGNGSNNGDPIVLYDQLADRWLVSEFSSSYGLSIGVSETNDPGGAYNVYSYPFTGLPDYPHYSVWHDGYYGTANYIGNGTAAAFIMDRSVMLAGGPSPQIIFWQSLPGIIHNPNTIKSAEAANLLGTTLDPSTPGYFTYLQDDAWGGVSFDHLKVWEAVPDWDNTANSTISAPLEIPTDPFDAGEIFGNGNGAIRQPGTSQRLSGQGGIISYAANYRPFATHNSWLITFNTFIDGNQTGGIRWIELRNDASNPWSIFQEGTYSIADGHSRVMSSSAMDAEGNIGLAYTTASTTLPVSLRYTGRYDGDALGMMTVAETIIFDGPGVRTNAERYGDYSHMTMDPDGFTFWYTGDYFYTNNQWRTRIAAFRIFGPFANDVGVSAINSPNNGILTNAETVEISIRNYSPNAITNVPVQLRVDGNLVATETYMGTINSNQAVLFQFAQTVNLSTAGQTYSIEARTTLNGDGYVPNNAFTKEVKHLLNTDVGVVAITSPHSSSGLGDETVTIRVKNFGAVSQSGFNVQYTIDAGAPVVQSFPGTIDSEEIQSFNFTQTADLNGVGTYTLASRTTLAGDQFPANDEFSVAVENLLCLPESNCTVGHGFRIFEVAGINNASGCEPNGYGDFTSLIANLAPGSTNDLTVTSDYGNQHISVWIDYDDNLFFSADEIVVDNYLFAAGQSGGTFTETMDLVLPANATSGEHRMRARASGTGTVPNNACDIILFGETEDYTANVGSLGINDLAIDDSSLIITSRDNKQFEVILQTSFEDGVFMGVYTILGQEVGFKKSLPKIDGAYRVNLDMTNAASGVYLIRVGGQATTTYKTGRIIVK